MAIEKRRSAIAAAKRRAQGDWPSGPKVKPPLTRGHIRNMFEQGLLAIRRRRQR